MPDIANIIQSGLSNPWLLLPMAIALGALHALEPGHSKSMMTAFIVAANGTVKQAALLGIAATVGHTIVVWVLALIAWQLAHDRDRGRDHDRGHDDARARARPWLMLVGGILLVVLAWRILARSGMFARAGHGHGHHHGHGHGHGHDHGHAHGSDHQHHHTHDTKAGHHHAHPAFATEDEHAAYHAAEVKKRFTGGPVSNAEVMWFGFTGGLLPCPAAFAVLLACLKTKAYALGVVMVAAFSFGLALMLVAIGAAAALGANALRSKSETFDRIAAIAPVLSAGIVLLIGLASMWFGIAALNK
jgi:nickel/cobalt transporter (NicO) family protein